MCIPNRMVIDHETWSDCKHTVQLINNSIQEFQCLLQIIVICEWNPFLETVLRIQKKYN